MTTECKCHHKSLGHLINIPNRMWVTSEFSCLHISLHEQQHVSALVFCCLYVALHKKQEVSKIACPSFIHSQFISSLMQQTVNDTALLAMMQPHTITGSELHCDSLLHDSLITWSSACQLHYFFSDNLLSTELQFVSDVAFFEVLVSHVTTNSMWVTLDIFLPGCLIIVHIFMFLYIVFQTLE